MSRHTLARQRNYGTLVVGYDRPLDNFFVQVWSNQENMQASHIFYDADQVMASLAALKVKASDDVLEELKDQLRAESEGLADTQTLKDWR